MLESRPPIVRLPPRSTRAGSIGALPLASSIVIATLMAKGPRRRGKPLGPQRNRQRRARGMAKRLIDTRKTREQSQQAAADEIGVDRATWALWELGRSPKRRIYKLVLAKWLAGVW